MQITAANPDSWSHLADFSTYYVPDELELVEEDIEKQQILNDYQTREN